MKWDDGEMLARETESRQLIHFHMSKMMLVPHRQVGGEVGSNHSLSTFCLRMV